MYVLKNDILITNLLYLSLCPSVHRCCFGIHQILIESMCFSQLLSKKERWFFVWIIHTSSYVCMSVSYATYLYCQFFILSYFWALPKIIGQGSSHIDVQMANHFLHSCHIPVSSLFVWCEYLNRRIAMFVTAIIIF